MRTAILVDLGPAPDGTTQHFLTPADAVAAGAGANPLANFESRDFLGGAIDAADDSIDLGAGHGLADGQAVIYTIAGNISLLAGDDVFIETDVVIDATNQILIRGDFANADAGDGALVDIDGNLDAVSVLIFGDDDDDVIQLHPQSLVGHTRIFGEGGEDFVLLDRLPTIDTFHERPDDGVTGLVRDTVDVDGGAATDAVEIQLTGIQQRGNDIGERADYLVNVSDSGARDDGVDTLRMLGFDIGDPGHASGDDLFLLRKDFVAYLNPQLPLVAKAGPGRPLPRGRAGQLRRLHQRAAPDRVAQRRRPVLRGRQQRHHHPRRWRGRRLLPDRPGVRLGSEPAGFGRGRRRRDRRHRDHPGLALARHQRGPRGLRRRRRGPVLGLQQPGRLRLEGGDDNDEFVIRAFAKVTGGSTADEVTEVAGGLGDDTIQYNVNAPVSIDGGAGYDTVVVIGTELDDAFVVTPDGVFGAGLNIELSGTEEALEVDALEGDDHIFVLGTSAGLITTVIGGLGSDTIDVMGDVTEPIIALDAEGRSGIIEHVATSAGDVVYDGLFVPGVNLNVADENTGTVVIEQSDGSTTVTEDLAGSVDTYTVSLAVAAADLTEATVAYVTVSAALAATKEKDQGAESVLVSTNGVDFFQAVVLTFDSATNWDSTQTIFVKAGSDAVAEGTDVVAISHSILSDNPAFNELLIDNVDVTVFDSEVPDLVIEQTNAETLVLEGANGITDTYSVALSQAPAAGETVTVDLQNADGEISLSATQLFFTDADWNVPQVVTVTAVDDGDVENTDLAEIVHVVSGAPSFQPAEDRVLGVLVHDDDAEGVVIQETDGSTLVSTAGLTDSYSIRLATQPLADVTIALQSDGQTLLTSADARFSTPGGIPTVTFTPADWFVPIVIDVAVDPAYVPVPGEEFIKEFAPLEHRAAQIRGPLVVEGGVPEGKDRSLRQAVMLPTETTDGPIDLIIETDETLQTDTLNVFNDGSVADDSGTMAFRTDITTPMMTITGLGMGGDRTVDQGTPSAPDIVTFSGGVAYREFEIVEVMLGSGDDSFGVADTEIGAITVVHGGGGSDTLTVTGGAGAGAPLILYGDTSADGSRYDSEKGDATAFDFPGNDIIDASAIAAGVTIFGGGGDDILTGTQAGDHIAGGSGNDTIDAQGGDDHVYGDSGFNADLSSRLSLAGQILTVVTNEATGDDTVFAGSGSDIVFGDHGIITQVAGTQRLLTTGQVERAETTTFASGGADELHGEDGDDFVFGGQGTDTITGDADQDVLFGDQGFVDWVELDGDLARPDRIETFETLHGASDDIEGNGGNDLIFGGTAGDTARGDDGSDLLFGDFGSVFGDVDLTQLPLGAVVDPFDFTSISTQDPNAGDDRLEGGEGDDIALGQQGSDVIRGDAGDDDLIGGHDVEDGFDAGDRIDGGTGNDWIAGDNARIDRSAAPASARFRTLSGTTLYDTDGNALVDRRLAAESERRAGARDHAPRPLLRPGEPGHRPAPRPVGRGHHRGRRRRRHDLRPARRRLGPGRRRHLRATPGQDVSRSRRRCAACSR